MDGRLDPKKRAEMWRDVSGVVVPLVVTPWVVVGFVVLAWFVSPPEPPNTPNGESLVSWMIWRGLSGVAIAAVVGWCLRRLITGPRRNQG